MNKFTKKLAQAAVAVAITVGTVGGSAGTASAAGGTAPDVRGCFTYATGQAYSSSPVQLYRWNGTSWAKIRSGKTSANGCAQFNDVMPNRYYAMTAFMTSGDKTAGIWVAQGETSYAYAPTGYDRLANVGTGLVRTYQVTNQWNPLA